MRQTVTNINRAFCRFVLTLCLSVISFAAYATDSIQTGANCPYYQSCEVSTQSHFSVELLLKMAGMLLIVFLATRFFYLKKSHLKYIIIGSAVSLVIVGATLFPIVYNYQTPSEKCDTALISKHTGTSNSNEFFAAGNEFESGNKTSTPKTDDFESANNEFKTDSNKTTSNNSEFENVDNEFTKPGTSTKSTFDTLNGSLDEFSASSDEFSATTNSKSDSAITKPTDKHSFKLINDSEWGLFYRIIVLFILTAICGYMVRYAWFRNTRGIVLLSSVIYLGFILGACPCMIMSLINFMLFTIGHDVSFTSMLWFLGLLPLTYFFGKAWCGWLCHLGALQELIYLPEKLTVLTSARAQKVLRISRIVFLIALISQVIISRSNLFVKIDPFKVAYNLFSANVTGYVLLVLLLLTSVLIYRPFCRAVCPVGLILGWVSKLKGAQKIVIDQNCTNCYSCSHACTHKAIVKDHKKTIINVEDCIYCGKCLETCKVKHAIKPNNFLK